MRTTTNWILAAALGLCLAPLGCADDSPSDFGNEGGTGGTGASGPTLAELPALLTDVYCDALTTCAGSMEDLQFPGSSCAAELQKQLEDGMFAKLPAALDSGKVKYDAGQVAACLAALRAEGCALFTTRASGACEGALDGAVPLGGDCTSSLECDASLYCKATDSCPGKCSEPEGAGVACSEDDACKSGLRCDESRGTCEAPRKVGERCKGDQLPDCDLGLLCFGDDAKKKTPGTCRDLDDLFSAKSGEPCDVMGGVLCATPAVCALVGVKGQQPDFQCVGKVTSGSACKLAFPSACPVSDFCDVPDPQKSLDGVCKALPAAGSPCVKTLFDAQGQCAPSTACVEGTCRTVERLGESCAGDSACYSKFCDGGTCAAEDVCSRLGD